MEFARTEKALQQLGDAVVERAQLELGIKQTFKVPKIKWQRAGKGWRGKKVGTRIRRGKINSSGQLSKSLKAVIEYTDGQPFVNIVGADYGIYVNNGRKAGKYAPPRAIFRYIANKPIKIRDSKTGAFKRGTPQDYESLAFLINRKLRYFGTEPTHFMDKAVEAILPKYEAEIEKALIDDFKNSLEYDD